MLVEYSILNYSKRYSKLKKKQRNNLVFFKAVVFYLIPLQNPFKTNRTYKR